MGIARAHHFAPVFEDLDRTDPLTSAEFNVLLGPSVDHGSNLGDLHASHCQAVVRMEADYAANASFRFGHQQALAVLFGGGKVRLQRSKVVVEDERARVIRVLDTARALVTRT
jgi:hypothetical protein